MNETVQNNGENPVRVMLVDDSIVIRGHISRLLKTDPAIAVVGSASNGKSAVDQIPTLCPDIVVLDIEMPVMDGLTAIPLILKIDPDIRIIVCSALSAKGADTTIRAMRAGATDFILKPSAIADGQGKDNFRDELLEKIHALFKGRTPRRITPPRPGVAAAPAPAVKAPSAVTLRPAPPPTFAPKILAVGSSTGGPNALADFLSGLKTASVPVVITQHMPKTFTQILAEQLTKTTGMHCVEGQQGMILSPGHVYIAPGGLHMLFEETPAGTAITLSDGPPENFCIPAVDPMLRSLISIYGGRILTVILTGMGADGLEGSRKVVAAGGFVGAQDEASSVVWGMPGAVAKAGLCSAVQPVSGLVGWVSQYTNHGVRR